MPTVDELGRDAATSLRREVHVDVDAGLRRLHATSPAAAPDRRRSWALAGAAAVLLLAVAAFVLIDRSPARQGPATNPPSVASTVAPTSTAAPPSTAAATVEPTTAASTTALPTSPPTTSSPSSTTAANAAATYDLTVFASPPTIDLPPLLDDLPLRGCDPTCPTIAGTDDGTVVAWYGDTQTFSVLALGASNTLTVPLQAPGTTGDSVVAIGPDDVAYLFSHPTATSVDDRKDLLAVALRGPHAGTVVASAQGVGDGDYVATAAGLVGVSCCGAETVRPAPGEAPIMAWVDADGRPVAGTGVYMTIDATPGYVTVKRSDSPVPFEVTAAVDTDPVLGNPRMAATPDGSVLVATWPTDATTWVLTRARPDGSSERLIPDVPDGAHVFALTPHGPIVAHGSALARWQLPGYAAPRPLDPTTLLGDRTFATSDDAIAAVLASLRTPDGCEAAPQAELTGTEARTTWTIARFTARFGCDDSGAGRAIAVALTPGADGRWTAAAAIQAALCRRGVSDGLCV